MVEVEVSLGGGLDVLFGGARDLGRVRIDEPTVRALISALVADARFDSTRADLFLAAAGRGADADRPSVRPGILVLVNDADWELSGADATVLADGDRVMFISTLHGG